MKELIEILNDFDKRKKPKLEKLISLFSELVGGESLVIIPYTVSIMVLSVLEDEDERTKIEVLRALREVFSIILEKYASKHPVHSENQELHTGDFESVTGNFRIIP